MNQTGTYSRGPAHPAARPMHRVLDGLIAQRSVCGGESCKRRHCHRCNRGRDYLRKERRAS